MKKSIMLLALIGVFVAFMGIPAMAEDTPKEAKPVAEDGKTAVVEDGKTVKVDYTLTVDGKIIDSSEGRGPLEFTAGAKQMIPGFEKALMGMKAGEKKSFDVSPEDGYGKKDPSALQEVPKDQLPEGLEIEVGMTLAARGPAGQTIPVVVSEIKEKSVIMDFNHPLAGKTLHFDVEVVEVK